MTGYAKYKVYKHQLNEAGEVIKTRLINSIWLPVQPRTDEERASIARSWKGDDLGSPDPADFDWEAKNRRPRFEPQIVKNLRESQPNLAEFTDDQIYNAYEDFAVSADYGDESLVAEWVDRS